MSSDWQDRAMCAGFPLDLWFPELPDGTDASDNHGADAKAICAQCPVIVDCAVAALERNEPVGIFGGIGTDLRTRWLRREWMTRTVDGARWSTAKTQLVALVRHEHVGFSDRFGNPSEVPDRNGPGAKCGRRVTYNRGCRCGTCCRSVNDDRYEVQGEPSQRVGGTVTDLFAELANDEWSHVA